MKKQLHHPDTKIEKALTAYQPDFSPNFEQQLMAKISQLSEQSYSYLFNRAFQRIALSGIAAVIALLISIFVADSSISTDTLLGTSNMDLETYTAMTFSGF